MKKGNKLLIVALIVAAVLISIIVYVVLPFALVLFASYTAEPVIVDNIDKYNNVIGMNGEYPMKWGLDEEIFPKKIKESYDVKNFKFVYYDPWDANYLTLLEIEYNEEDYKKEISRLEDIGVERYKGFYGAEGFKDYELVAMDSDSYNGFIYAITDNESKIIYIELIFCNYVMDIDYEEYIPKEYLPVGFNAKENNPYRNKMMNE